MKWLWQFVKLTVVVSFIAGIVYWVRFQPVSVEEYEAARGLVLAEVMGTGTLEARIKATVSPKISGRIEEVLVDMGDRVTAGQLLVRLDNAELTQQVAIAEADVETRRAAIERLESDISRALAILKQANTNFQRLDALIKENAVSKDEFEKGQEAQAVADSEWARANAALAEGQKSLVVAEQSLQFQKTRLLDSEIKAPFDGLIVRRVRDPGDIVVPGSTILSLIATDELLIEAWVDETQMSQLAPEQTAKVVFRSESETVLPGKLVRLGRETDRETREFLVDVQVLNLPTNWAVGQRAEVYVETARATNVVCIPTRFVQQRSGESGVWINQAGAVSWQPIETGLLGRDMVEVKRGIEAGQLVVLPDNNSQSLRNGQRIIRK
jgi:HlyD family secretion protein